MDITPAGLHILLVDDDPAILLTLKTTLGGAGHVVIAVSSSTDALRLAKEDPFDVVITDWMMPGMDGIELTRRIREGRRPPPILIMSSLNGPEPRTHAIQAGADDYVLKPIDVQALLALLAPHARALHVASERNRGGPSLPPRFRSLATWSARAWVASSARRACTPTGLNT